MHRSKHDKKLTQRTNNSLYGTGDINS